MAIALEKLEDQLNCSVCLDTYTNPKQLQCHHVYCQKCLVKLVFRDQQGQLSLTCPHCRVTTPVPANGVRELSAAFRVNQLLEIVEEYKKPKSASGGAREESALTSTNLQESIAVVCPEHGGKEVDLYCETCDETICWKCIMKGSRHHSHNYEELNQAFERYKKEILSLLEPMEEQLTATKEALAQLETCCDEISSQELAIEADIHHSFAQIQEALNIRKTELINQLHLSARTKLKRLAVQKDQIEMSQAQLSSCLHFLRENLITSNHAEVLMMRKTTVRQVKKLTTTFQPKALEPITEANLIFSILVDLASECQKYGQVSTTDSADPSKCYITGKGVGEAVVEEVSTIILQTLTSMNNPCESPSIVMCKLVSELSGIQVNGNVESVGKSQYKINYRPTIKGKHQLHIEVEGQQIKGSPFLLTTRLPVDKLGEPILTVAMRNGPEVVAFNRNSELVVTEWDGNRVIVFSPSGEQLRTFGTLGSGPGQFEGPSGVAVDLEGNILVADWGNNRIQKFTSHGEFLTAVGSQGRGPLKFDCPRGIAVSAKNGKVYVGCEKGGLQILNSDLSYYGTFGNTGKSKGEFNNPRCITCDSVGNVYVADQDNHRIQVFTAEGKFLKMFGSYGTKAGELDCPWGIGVDSDGRVYVSEWGNHRVSVFNSNGMCVMVFGKFGIRLGQFNFTGGLAVDSNGVVCVCDFSNYRLQLF